MIDVSATCSRKFTAAHTSGSRPAGSIKWIVLHSTEGPTARAAAEWFQDPSSEGSAHLVVDDKDCFRTLDNDQVAWAAPGANTAGLHIEQAGFAHWIASEWRHHDLTLRRSAYKAALHARAFGIPLRWVGPLGLKLGRKGVTTHADCTKAFGGSHTDPGPGFPRDLWMRYAREYAAAQSPTKRFRL